MQRFIGLDVHRDYCYAYQPHGYRAPHSPWQARQHLKDLWELDLPPHVLSWLWAYTMTRRRSGSTSHALLAPAESQASICACTSRKVSFGERISMVTSGDPVW